MHGRARRQSESGVHTTEATDGLSATARQRHISDGFTVSSWACIESGNRVDDRQFPAAFTVPRRKAAYALAAVTTMIRLILPIRGAIGSARYAGYPTKCGVTDPRFQRVRRAVDTANVSE